MKAFIYFMLLTMLGGFCMNKKEKQTLTDNNTTDTFYEKRYQMVENQIKARNVTDKRVLEAMLKVPRHKFVPDRYKKNAYNDNPLSIGFDQTISQPFIVAYMTEALVLTGDERVLEIGTGSGYQAAVLCELAKEVYSIEIVEPLCLHAKKLLAELNYTNFNGRCGDGYAGWPEAAPFDAIIVTAAPDHIPQALVNQLKPGGRMILPVGESFQKLVLILKNEDGSIRKKDLIAVRFVPMTGDAE
ncbi:protein-L-isoaspartate(D-aspartate) O-methyltransferase [candidate division KSB1 bacterium]|nr:protein-L-isoaspartate(D-aspartate) O-methyltransferase [candidate division KSB1 bacterium]